MGQARYDSKFKELVVHRILNGETTIAEMARELELHYTTVRDWVRHYKKEAKMLEPFDWAEITQALLDSLPIVEDFNVFKQDLPGFVYRLEVQPVYLLPLLVGYEAFVPCIVSWHPNSGEALL